MASVVESPAQGMHEGKRPHTVAELFCGCGGLSHGFGCLRCLLLVMCTHPFAKKALTLHLARSKGHGPYWGCNLTHRKVLASFHQHLMAEAPQSQLLGRVDVELAKTRFGTRMHRKHQRQPRADATERPHQLRQYRWLIDVRRAMHRDDTIRRGIT